MNLAKIVGTVVATQKAEGLEGHKLLIAQEYGFDLKPRGGYVLASDVVGAGVGELVVAVQGASARMTLQTTDKPVDAAIIAIVDSIDLEGNVVFRKGEEV